MAYVEEVMNDYKNSLRDLNFNSKPLINMLTMLAEENEQHAPCIVKVIEDEIIKVDEKTRASMYKLRQTWTPLFPNARLYGIDVKIQSNLDPAWPITATAPEQTSIHVNPNFLKKSETETSPEPEPEMSPDSTPEDSPKEEENLEEQESLMRQQLIAKQQELLKLQQARLELELAETQEKLDKQKKKNTKLSAQDEHVLPDTTVHPSSLDTVPAPRDPRTSNPLYSRTAGRDPHIKDPRLKGSPLPVQSSLVPHSTTPGGLPLPSVAAVPPPESAFIPVPPYSGPAGMPHYVGAFPPGIPGAIPPGIQPPFMQSGQLHINPGFLASQNAPPPPVEGHFRGEVYHPDSSDDNDIKSQDSGPVSKSDNLKTKPKVPTTNRRDPRQARKEMEQGSHIDLDSNRSMRESAGNNRDNVLDRNSYDRNSGRNSNRSSRDRDQRSRSPHSSSRSPRTSESGRDKSDSKSRDPRLKRHADDDRRKDTERWQDDRVGPNDNKHGSLQRNDDRRHSRDKSPERSPKYSKRSEKDRLDKGEDRSKHQKDMKRSSKERSASPSKHKVRNKNDNAKKSGSVERTDKSGKDVKVKTPKRELEKDDLVPVEDESLSKKAKIEPVDVKPIIEGADVLGKIQEDISELFGGEDQDYRPTDSKGLPLKSPSSKGWDKFKADHPDQYAYDIELKRQRSESMDVDQRPPEEALDTDYRLQPQTSWSEVSNNESRRESTEEVSIPVELSMEHHAEILIQAHKHLQEGKLTHEQHQLLLQQLGELMKIQKLQEETRKIQQLQDASRRLSLEAERIKQNRASLDEDIRNMSPIKPEAPVDRDLRLPSPMTPENAQRVPPNIDSTPPGPPVSRPPGHNGDFGPPGHIPDDARDRYHGTPIRDQNRPDVREHPPGDTRDAPPGISLPPMQPPPRPFFVKDGTESFDGPMKDVGPFDRGDHNRNDLGPADRRGMGPPPPEIIPSGRFDNIPGDVRNFDGRPGPQDRMGPDQQVLHGLPDMGNIGPPRSDHGVGRDFDGRHGPQDRMGPDQQMLRGPPDMGNIVPPGSDHGVGRVFDGRPGPQDRMGPDQQMLRGPPDMGNIGPPGSDHGIGRDFDGRPDPQDRIGSEQRMPHGPPDMRDIEPQGPDHGPTQHEIDHVPTFERAHGLPDQVRRGFPDEREGPPDRRDFGPPDRFIGGLPGEMGIGAPDRFDKGHRDGEGQDRMDMQDDRRDFEFHGRRNGPPGERELGPPDRMNGGPPGRMGHRPPDMDFDRRNEPPGGRGRGRGFGPQGRMEMGHDRGGPGRRDPDWRDHGPPGMGLQDRDGGPQGMGHPAKDHGVHLDREHRSPGMGHPDRDHGHHPDRDHGPGMGHQDGPPGMGHPDRDRGHHPDGDRGPPSKGHPDVNHGPQGRRGPDWRDHGPPDRMGGRPDFKPDGPHDEKDFGPADRRDHGLPDRRGVRPEGRDHGHPHERRDGPPDRFHEERKLEHEDRMDMGPPRLDGRGSPERFGHGRGNERPHGRGREQHGRFDGPPDGRNWGPQEGRGEWGPPEGRGEWGQPGRAHGPPGFRAHGPMDRMPHGPPEMRDQRPLDGMGPENQRDGTPDWNERGPGWRDHGHPDRRIEPERWTGQPDRRDGPNDRKNGPRDRDDRRAGPLHNKTVKDNPPKDTGDKEPHEENEPEWPLGDKGHPFNPGKAELEKIEKIVSERKTPPIYEANIEDSTPLKADQEHETRQTSVEKDVKPVDKTKDENKLPASTESGEEKGQKIPLLPTPPAHLKKSSSDTKEDQTKSEAPVKKDIKYIPALLALPTIKPTKKLFIEPIKDLPEEETEREENKDTKTGLGKWKTTGKSKKSGQKSNKNENKDADSDDDAEERQHNPFAVGSFLKEMLPPPKEKKPPVKEEKKPTKKVEKKKQERNQKKAEREEKPNGKNEKRQTGRNEKKQDRNEKKLQDKGVSKDDRRPQDERRDHGKTEKDKPKIEEIRPHGRDEMRPPGRDEMRPPGKDEMVPHGKDEIRPPGKNEMGPHGKDEMRPHGRDGMRPHGRDEMRQGREEMRPPGIEDIRPPGREDMRPPPMRWEGPPRHPNGRHVGPRPLLPGLRGPMPRGQMMDGPHGPMMDGPRGPMMDGPHGPMMDGPRGPMMDGPHGPMIDGPHGPMMDRPLGPMMDGPRGPQPPGMDGPPVNQHEEDPRWTSYTDMGPEVSEEVVIGNKNYAIKLGDRPRVVKFFNENIEVYADASKRGIVIDGNLMYKFGERVKEVELKGRTVRMFYHGKPVNLWIDGQNYEIRVDAPPRNIEINGNNHKIQIDGRDMMILIDKIEKGPFGGPPRFIFIDEDRMEIRFDPPPRHILIDGKLCELMLALKRPCVNIEGKLHGIRFDGPPREVVINNQVFMIHTDKAVKVRVDNKLHYICLGGPCHEIIIDGKWYEMKFSEPPKEVNVGNRILAVHLPGKPPEVKILPEILAPMPVPIGMPMGPGMIGPGPLRPMGPGMEPVMRGPMPMGPGQRPMVPIPLDERPPFPMAPRPEVSQPGAFPMNRPPIPGAHPMAPPFPGPDSQPRPVLPQPPVSMGAPVTSAGGMPNVLATMFPNIPQPRLPASTLAPPSMDINILLQKLVATGIIKKEPEPTSTAPTTAATAGGAGGGLKPMELMNVRKKMEKQESLEEIPDMTDMDISLMKELPNGVIQRIYAGIQCTTCGVRFVLDDEEKTEKYREHLDWHFRQKRREKDEMKVSRNRHWYYGVNDWLQYEEITDTEETGRSTFFERQQQMVQQPTPATPSNMSFALITVPEGATVTRCPAATGNDSDDLCAICHEPFEQFWDEELEEWHLRDAIRVNDQTYHPICYEDHTDVSEGTPSPSALPMLPPDFSARKTLSYDESSQDAVNTSFVGEREVVKTEPVLDTDSKDAVRAAIKDVITISDSPIKPVTHKDVKSEPMDTTDSAIVNQEIEKPKEETTVVQYEVTSIVKSEPVLEDVSNSQIDSTSVSEPVKDSTSVSEPVKDENQSNNAINQPIDQEITDTDSASQIIPESTQNDTEVTAEKVATATETVPMATDIVPVATETVSMATDTVVASAVPESVIHSSEAVGSSPLPQESGGSTPVQDERSRSNTPTKDECPGTPVMDEPMVE